MALLNAVSLTHEFDYPLFNEVSYELNPSKSMSVVGVSGCGKSTLLHVCETLSKPNSDIVEYNGKTLYDLKERELTKIRRDEVGIIFQSHYLFKGFNALENVELSAILSNTQIDEELLEKLGIQHVMRQNVGELSGGQQQRISIARVLSKKPRLIFADEPTGNLDQDTAKEVMNVLFDYVKENNAGLMLVTHDKDLAKKCDTPYVLENNSLKEA